MCVKNGTSFIDVVGGGIGGGAASDPDHDREAFESMWNRGPDEVFANLWNMDQEAAARYAEHEAKTESQSAHTINFTFLEPETMF